MSSETVSCGISHVSGLYLYPILIDERDEISISSYFWITTTNLKVNLQTGF